MSTSALEVKPQETAVALRQAFLASQKAISIEIAREDIERLKTAEYKLCFAKRVGDNAYNVVWQSYSGYLLVNQFSWTPMYQLFGANEFVDGSEVKPSTNIVDIGLEEISVLDGAGHLGQPQSGGDPTGFTLVNEYGAIHAGVMQLSIGIDGKMKSAPIYVSADQAVPGETVLTPVDTVLVWFEQNVETSTMFSTSRSNAVEIDMTSSDHATLLYANQRWIIPE